MKATKTKTTTTTTKEDTKKESKTVILNKTRQLAEKQNK